MISTEKLYGLTTCTFNVHCLTLLARSVTDCGPLWATSAFTFEAHNHALVNMFSGTQYVPEQVVHTFLLRSKATMLARSCIDADCSVAVENAMKKFTTNKRYKSAQGRDGLSMLGLERVTVVDARIATAVQDLIGQDVVTTSAIHYDRFISDHLFYSSKNCVRQKTQ